MNLDQLKQQLLDQISRSANPEVVLRDPALKKMYAQIPKLEPAERATFGKAINHLKIELETAVTARQDQLAQVDVTALDVTAPTDVNQPFPQVLSAEFGGRHPLMTEIDRVTDIYTQMGFEAIESRQIDDDFHMFTSLNFPANHPARDDYDTFRTEEGLIPPAHTSTMQYRILQAGLDKLARGEAIATVSYGRVFRNEDVDATHEHTFYQCEGVYVAENIGLSHMISVLKEFFDSYYQQDLAIKTQPGYFPFVEPGLEFLIERPASLGGKPGDWLEMMGCGMIHPNVLEIAGVDPKKYSGFAWGGGIDRLVLLKYGIDDVRHFESAKLNFLRKFV